LQEVEMSPGPFPKPLPWSISEFRKGNLMLTVGQFLVLLFCPLDPTHL